MIISMRLTGYSLGCALPDAIPWKPRVRLTISHIQEAVAQHFSLPDQEMTSARCARRYARPRQVAMYLSREFTPQSLPEIGRRFGGRDHTTVIHAIRRIEQLRFTDPELDADVRALERELSA